MIDVFIWIIVTLAASSLCIIIAKHHGPEYIIALVAGMAVIANVLAGAKIVQFMVFAVDAGTIVYGSIFLLTDMLNEFYGKRTAKKAVWAGFLASIMLIISIQIAFRWTAAPFYDSGEAFSLMFGNTSRIVIASLIAYLISQHIDVFIYSWLKKKTSGKMLWLRNNASTAISQGIDTVLFITIAFAGTYPILGMMVGLYVAKMIIAALDTPFLYLARWYVGKREG